MRNGGRKLSLYIRHPIVYYMYKAPGLSTVKIQTKISVLRIRSFINRHKKTKSLVDHRYNPFLIQKKEERSISLICLHYDILPLLYTIIIFLGVRTVHNTNTIKYGSIFVNFTALFDACTFWDFFKM